MPRPRAISRRILAAVAAGGLTFSVLAATSGAGAQDDGELEMYTAEVSGEEAAEIAADGFDVTASSVHEDRVDLDLVLSDGEVDALRGRGIDVEVKRNGKGRTARQEAATQAASGYEVWRSWDEAGGIRDELYGLARRHPQLVKLVELGETYQGRELLAVKLTQGARGRPDGSRPAVLYSSTQHAREWISTEVNRRLMHWFIDGWMDNDREIKRLLRGNELWFVLVANPDGYQYTFDEDRLWRKNLRDNDGDGEVSLADGVDPNRNYPAHFKYDNEGSASLISDQTYRGPSPASEPETQAMIELYDRVPFSFHVNWHSYGEWLLYPEGWQIGTPTADDPIYYAMSGNRDNPTIEGFEPGLSSDVLYVTNGETTDYAHAERGTLAWTPELGEGTPGSGFVFPDDEALVQAEFEKTLPFALDVAESAADPDDPESHLGLSVEPFYLESDDTYKAGLPLANFTFDYSYGDPQEVRVLAKRSLGDVTLKYRVNDGEVVSAPTEEWNGGERYGGETGVHYAVMSGVVTGTDPGDTVEVWFEGGGESSDSFTYTAVEESGNDVLILAAEDYTGASPGYAGGPNYLEQYEKALADNGEGYDVYDVDARNRTAPDSLGVLSHYEAVVWYTGDDIVTREAGWAAGNASRLAMDEILEVRDFLNEGGKVLYTGSWAGSQYTQNVGLQVYDPTAENAECTADPAVEERCRLLAGSGDLTNDVLQYWLGAYLVLDDAGTDEDGDVLDVMGTDDPFTGLTWGFNGPDSADNQHHSNSAITTSGILDPEEFPQFESWAAARWDREGGPFEPHTGEYYVYSQIGDVSYKRLTSTISVPEGGATLTFRTSYDTETAWDHLFVEARTAGGDDWTTLPDQNGNTTQATGDSCASGWRELHPHLDHYQTVVDGSTCSPTGSTGEWWAASGNSGGWQEWTVDLSDYAGGEAEISIAYASDWATQGLGVFVDDIEVSTGEGTSFEDGFGGWEVTGPPEGSAPNPNNFVRSTAAGFPEAATVATPGSLFAGFGLEGITGAEDRAAVMGRALDHLLE